MAGKLIGKLICLHPLLNTDDISICWLQSWFEANEVEVIQVVNLLSMAAQLNNELCYIMAPTLGPSQKMTFF